MERVSILGGKVQLYRRDPAGGSWHCSASVGGKQRRATTKELSLAAAKQVAEDWYLEMRGKDRAGVLISEKNFRAAATYFLREYEVITEGERSAKWVAGHGIRLRVHLLPFFGDLGLSQITAGKVQEYRVHRMTTWDQPNPHSLSNRKLPTKPPSRSTIHNEIITLRLALKAAVRHGWLAYVPDLSAPYKTQGKITHRPWFSPDEYRQLYRATRAYAKKPFHEHYRWSAEQLHDYVLFMAGTGLRPDEAGNLEHRDVVIVDDEESGERILEIEVRGKRGIGFCKSMPTAVRPYERLLARPRVRQESRRARRARERLRPGENAPEFEVTLPKPTDKVFPGGSHVQMFNRLLHQESLKFDRDGKARTAYSLRHTYICMRLSDGADIYQVAKNCRTSVEMIQKFYAAHIKNLLHAASINVRRMQPPRRQRTGEQVGSAEAA